MATSKTKAKKKSLSVSMFEIIFLAGLMERASENLFIESMDDRIGELHALAGVIKERLSSRSEDFVEACNESDLKKN